MGLWAIHSKRESFLTQWSLFLTTSWNISRCEKNCEMSTVTLKKNGNSKQISCEILCLGFALETRIICLSP